MIAKFSKSEKKANLHMDIDGTPQSKKEIAKAKRRKKFSQAAPEGLRMIAAKQQPGFYEDTSEKRVAVYARVSTDDENQTSSYEMQQLYYSEMVQNREGWRLVNTYADEGITGTSINHRNAFNQMITDCEAGLIDIILTKSVSRFSRNIIDSIGCVRKLAALKNPVGVYFENEGLFSLASDSEMRLSFLAAMAQEESHIKSMSMNSSIEMRFSHGIFLTPPLLGYDNDEDGRLILNDSEAGIVRLIFFLYLYGYTTERIAWQLTQLGRRTKKGNVVWNAGSVNGILRNERYCGDVLARKTWTPNYLDHRSIRNKSAKNQYYKENHHEPIISRDDFIAVQRMLDNAKYGCQSFLPQLQVMKGGALHGFVSVNPHWAAFTPEDYCAASASAGEEEPSQAKMIARCGAIDLRGYAVVNAIKFSRFGMNSVTLLKSKLRCSCTCAQKLDTEHAELLVHPEKKLLALRCCTKEHRNAIRLKQCGAKAFYDTLCVLFAWEPEQAHVLIGALRRAGDECFLLFDADSGNEPYYKHLVRQQCNQDAGSISEYNSCPDLCPTEPVRAEEQIRTLGGTIF